MWLPGRHELARELRVSKQTAENAVALLEKEGLIVAQGAGKRRRIMLPEGERVVPKLRDRDVAVETA
jgi:Mn-dependent DtxR family transcriptional regulator